MVNYYAMNKILEETGQVKRDDEQFKKNELERAEAEAFKFIQELEEYDEHLIHCEVEGLVPFEVQ